MVISCNMVAGGVLWMSHTRNSHRSDMPGNRFIEWVYTKYCSRTADKGKLSVYCLKGLVIPVCCPPNSLVVMGGSFQENMVHWTDKR